MNGIGAFGLDIETKDVPSNVHVDEAAIPATQQAPESPEWWRAGTPLAIEYALVMQVDEKWEQEIQLTRGEFIALKEHLGATIRGYEPMETPDA